MSLKRQLERISFAKLYWQPVRTANYLPINGQRLEIDGWRESM